MNILHLTPDFNYSDGRSYYVYLLLKYFKKTHHNVFLCTNAGDSFDRLDGSGIPYFVYPTLSKKSSFLRSLKQISNIVESSNIDIIHSHHRYYELLSNSFKKNKNTLTVFTSLSIVDKRYFVEYKSDKIIAVSNCIKDMLINKFNVKENKITVIPNFTESMDPAASVRNLFNDPVCILAVGRFHREKNFETIIKAVSLIKDTKIKLIFIGEGPEKNKYESLIRHHSINAVILPPQKDLSKFFDAADICVLSSLRDPLPGFMLQSGIYNKPFIGSNTDGIAEVIENEVNGLLFERKNESELSSKIMLFINNKDLAAKCAENLFKLVYGKFTEKSVIPELEKLYMS